MTRVSNRKTYTLIAAFIIVIMALALVLGSTSVARADGGFEIVKSNPADGSNNAAVENLCVKITFSTPVDSEENREANEKCFKLIGPDGSTLPTKVYYNPKQSEQLLVLYDATTGGQITSRVNETYKLEISKDLVDNDGNILGKDTTITFESLNQSRNTRVYFVMMLLMMAAMAFMTQRQLKKSQSEEGGDTPKKDEPFNPYKEAKRTGKSVAEVMAEHEKEVAKQEAKAAKRAAAEAVEEEEEEEDNGNYKVKGPRPISEGGSTYITGRKALAEAKKAEEERLAKRRAKYKKK